MTFNWAVLVAYAAKTETMSLPLFILYAGLIFWTVGYDTIYACQDIEDDMKIGVKSTARRFGKRVKFGVRASYLFFTLATLFSSFLIISPRYTNKNSEWFSVNTEEFPLYFLPFILHLIWQTQTFKPKNSSLSLTVFKSNGITAVLLIIGLILLHQKTQTAVIPNFIPPKID